MYLSLNDLLTIINLMNTISEQIGLTEQEQILGLEMAKEANILLGYGEGDILQ